MSTTPITSPTSSFTPVVSFSTLTTILFDTARWKILRELARGEALPVSELTRRVRKTRDIVQRNMGVLKESKLVVQTYGRLYRLAPGLTVSPDGTRLDLGYCILCLDRIPN